MLCLVSFCTRYVFKRIRFLEKLFNQGKPSLSPGKHPPARDDAIIQLMPSCWKAIQSTNSQLRLAALRLAMLMPPEALAKLLKHPGDPTESWVVDGYFEDVFFRFFNTPKTLGKSDPIVA